jgi:hypothetical protein
MEGLNRLVAESLARHGFDRPVDYRRLHWSRWFRCESHHSLLFVPSKPGIFALAEEVMDFVEGPDFSRAVNAANSTAALAAEKALHPGTNGKGTTSVVPQETAMRAASAAEGIFDRNDEPATRRMLAVLQFGEDDDMAFVLDRMTSRLNPMRSRLASGRCFLRYVVIEDQAQRRSLCNSLNQWLTSSSEKATGIGAHFATSLELTPDTNTDRVGAQVDDSRAHADAPQTPYLNSGAATNIHCPHPLPSGF